MGELGGRRCMLLCLELGRLFCGCYLCWSKGWCFSGSHGERCLPLAVILLYSDSTTSCPEAHAPYGLPKGARARWLSMLARPSVFTRPLAPNVRLSLSARLKLDRSEKLIEQSPLPNGSESESLAIILKITPRRHARPASDSPRPPTLRVGLGLAPPRLILPSIQKPGL